jgi:hypothetical protein
MRYSLLLLIITISVSSSVAQDTLHRVWVNRYAKTPGNQPHEIPAGLGVDDNGNVYVTMSEAVNEWLQWVTISYQDDGDLRWEKTISSENGFCEPAGLAVEENGSKVYVTGYYRYDDDAKDNFYTVKYNGANGADTWTPNPTFGFRDHDRAKAISIDNDHVYVTGYVDTDTAGPSGQDHAFCTIKYNKTYGSTDWVRIFNPSGDDEEACAIAVLNGNVYVTGKRGQNTRWDFLTIKYNSNGDSVWVQRFDAAGYDDEPTAIAVDDDENVYITGYSELSSTNSDFYTISYNSSGDSLWAQRYNGTDNREDCAYAIALDDSEHVYVTGSCRGKDSLQNFMTIKYETSDGDLVWKRTYDDSIHGKDSALALTVEKNGKYVYVTGEVEDDSGDYYTIVYEGDGNVIAYDQYDGEGTGYNEDYANKISIDDDYIYVTGASMGENFNEDNFDCVTIKYGKPNNVGCSTIVALTDTIDSGAVYTPACSVYNYGSGNQNYWVRMMVGNPGNWFYIESTYVTTHLPCSQRYVTFQPYSNWPTGTYTVKCSTELSNDVNQANDKKIKLVVVIIKDVGCTKILAPTGTVDSGAVVTPACSVYNYGTKTESYVVRMRIGNLYNQTDSVLNHSPGTYEYITFPNWTALERGTNTVRCSTEIATDANKANDKKTDSVIVKVIDVGCSKIIAPTSIVDTGTVVTPACSVYNYGTTTESYNVRMKIGNFYDESTFVMNHSPGTHSYVTFPNWTALQRGTHIVKCSTALAADMNKVNDKKTDSVFVRVIDVGCSKICAPTGTVDSGTVVTPACSVYNYGNVNPADPSYSVRMKIGRFYDQTVNITLFHNPGTVIYVTFRDWVATQVGIHAVTCSTQLFSDKNKANDKQTGSVRVQGSKGGGLNNEVTAITIDSSGVKVQNPNEVNSKEIEKTTESSDSGTIVTPVNQVHNQGNMGSTIQIKTGINDVAILRIYNVLGKLLHLEKVENGRFTMDGLPTGIYILGLQTKDRTEIRKLLIVK